MENMAYKDMTAIDFLREFIRMCKGRTCNDCDALKFKCKIYVDSNSSDEEINKAVEVVYEWSRKNPSKTRLSEYLKIFPNASLDMYDFPINCIRGYDKEATLRNCDNECEECKREFWLEEIN